jgi:hypothetical protein
MARDHHPNVWQIQKDISSLICHHHLAKAKATTTTTTTTITPTQLPTRTFLF